MFTNHIESLDMKITPEEWSPCLEMSEGLVIDNRVGEGLETAWADICDRVTLLFLFQRVLIFAFFAKSRI